MCKTLNVSFFFLFLSFVSFFLFHSFRVFVSEWEMADGSGALPVASTSSGQSGENNDDDIGPKICSSTCDKVTASFAFILGLAIFGFTLAGQIINEEPKPPRSNDEPPRADIPVVPSWWIGVVICLSLGIVSLVFLLSAAKRCNLVVPIVGTVGIVVSTSFLLYILFMWCQVGKPANITLQHSFDFRFDPRARTANHG